MALPYHLALTDREVSRQSPTGQDIIMNARHLAEAKAQPVVTLATVKRLRAEARVLVRKAQKIWGSAGEAEGPRFG